MRDLLGVHGRSLALVSVVAVAAASQQAAAVTIDFDSLQHVDLLNTTHGPTYTEDGFLLDGPGAVFRSFGSLRSDYSGSSAIYNNPVDGVIRLTQVGGGTFDLASINLAELNGADATAVTFTGTFGIGGTISQTHTLDGIAFGQQTFTFTGFTGLSQVTWVQASPFHQFDNIVVAVPEPGTFAILTLGALVCTRRRRTAR